MLFWFKKKEKRNRNKTSLTECVTGDVLYSEKKTLRSMKQADAKPHLGLQGNASVFHLNLFSRGQKTEEEVWEKHHGVTRLTPP